MDKTVFALILIFSSVVPQLVWGRTGNSHRTNYSIPDCKLKHNYCIYPLACFCSKPRDGGYNRLTLGEERWYYDRDTHKCQKHQGESAGCNNHDDQDTCERRCNNATALVKEMWPTESWQAVWRQ
uniref:Pancreatic trypsin inhibitor n=1 Tax=Rhipicephalus appendiculatus TaxID=34631 RepID=A0A131YHL4_RHIAP